MSDLRPLVLVPGLAAVDYERLAEELRALAYTARLELLSLLRAPATLGDIDLTPRGSVG